MGETMQWFGKFVRNYPSLTLLLTSTILTAYFLQPSIFSIIIHLMNLGLLGFVRFEARRGNYALPFIGIFVSTGLSAVMIHPDNWLHGIVIIINFILLLFMIGIAKKDLDLFARHDSPVLKP